MNSLKFALSTKEPSTKDKADIDNSLLRGVNKSKNQSLWALDVDTNDEVTEETLNTDKLLKVLHDQLQTAFQKDNKIISEVKNNLRQNNLDRIIEKFRDEVGGVKS